MSQATETTEITEEIGLDNERTFHLKTDVTHECVTPIINGIMYANMKDYGIPPEERVPIILFISSMGGDEVPGHALMDMIDLSQTPVYTINIGGALSMAGLILLAGHKRYSLKSSPFLLHDGTFEMGMINTCKMYDTVAHQQKRALLDKEYVTKRTNITSETYDRFERHEWYLLPEEAKELGVIDGIIGEDITLEEVLNA